MNIAIVTGASSGLGAEIVRQLAEGAFGPLDQIWAVSRRAEKTGPLVRPFALDLTDPASFDVLEEALDKTPDARVALLVNNAGFGTATLPPCPRRTTPTWCACSCSRPWSSRTARYRT